MKKIWTWLELLGEFGWWKCRNTFQVVGRNVLEILQLANWILPSIKSPLVKIFQTSWLSVLQSNRAETSSQTNSLGSNHVPPGEGRRIHSKGACFDCFHYNFPNLRCILTTNRFVQAVYSNAVMKHYFLKTAPASANSPMEVEKISFEGKVVQKLECRPTGTEKQLWGKFNRLI